MMKLVCLVAVGVGAALFAGASPAEAQRAHAETFSRGVTMKCSAATRTCRFHNVRPKARHCTFSVNYVTMHPRRGREHRAKNGNVFVAGGGRQRQSFHFGRSEVRRIKGISLLCRHRRHW